MLARPIWGAIARDEALTRGLGDAEARMVVEWLIEQADALAAASPAELVPGRVAALCRRARAIVRFVRLWCHEDSRGAAGQLAAAERFEWPLPTSPVDPVELMLGILKWEGRHLAVSGDW